jgi:hypothetical protein
VTEPFAFEGPERDFGGGEFFAGDLDFFEVLVLLRPFFLALNVLARPLQGLELGVPSFGFRCNTINDAVP